MNNPHFGTFRGADIYTGEMVFGWVRQTPHNWIIHGTGNSLEPGCCNQVSVHPESLAMFTGIYTTEYAKFIPTEKFKKISKDNQIGKATLEMREFYKGFHPTHNHGKPIYGNIPLPDGTMSKGGDILSGDRYPYFNEGIQNYVAIPSWNGDATYHVVGGVKGISHGLPINEEIDELKIIGNGYESPELLEGEG